MSAATKIEWADSTFNPWIGCTKVGPGCDHCYAEAQMDKRMGRVRWGAGQQRVRTGATYWRQPLLWNRRARIAQNGWESGLALANGDESALLAQGFIKPRRPRVFCASLADVFDNEVPSGWRIDLFDLIRSTPNLDWLLLTKRIGNAEKMIDEAGGWSGIGAGGGLRNPLPNVWLGSTVVNQEEADRDIPKLLATSAAVRFLSIEPMLGPIDLTEWLWIFQPCKNCPCPNPRIDRAGLDQCCRDPELVPSALHWVIAGGESGPGSRPAHPDWFRSLRDQCAATGVPFLFKQWGEWAPNFYLKDDGTPDWPTMWMDRMGKKAAGRLLDGAEHSGFPQP